MSFDLLITRFSVTQKQNTDDSSARGPDLPLTQVIPCVTKLHLPRQRLCHLPSSVHSGLLVLFAFDSPTKHEVKNRLLL